MPIHFIQIGSWLSVIYIGGLYYFCCKHWFGLDALCEDLIHKSRYVKRGSIEVFPIYILIAVDGSESEFLQSPQYPAGRRSLNISQVTRVIHWRRMVFLSWMKVSGPAVWLPHVAFRSWCRFGLTRFRWDTAQVREVAGWIIKIWLFPEDFF